MIQELKDKKESLEVVDVRKLSGNFLPMILKKAEKISVDEGMCVVQSFEPIPLYSALSDMGFEHETEKVTDNEYRVYFHRKEESETSDPGGSDVPLKPTAIVNFKKIDDSLADLTVNFWNLIWGKEESALGQKTKLLLSLANAVGAGRFRQATRELVKVYSLGAQTAELDELFSLFVWNQGVGHFASEIGPSPLFGAYQLIKKLEEAGKTREEVLSELVNKFGEKNPAVGTFHRNKD